MRTIQLAEFKADIDGTLAIARTEPVLIVEGREAYTVTHTEKTDVPPPQRVDWMVLRSRAADNAQHIQGTMSEALDNAREERI